MHAIFPQDFFQEGEHKEVHIHEDFKNYGVLEMVAVKFVHYCYHSSNKNLGDFSN
jgi:hypothetical protein